MYFKNKEHEIDTYKISENFRREFGKDVYYDSFAYLSALSGKVSFIIKHSGPSGVDSAKIKEEMTAFSASEQNLIALALQLFSAEMSDVTIHEVLSPLSTNNMRAVLTALELRYGLVKAH